MSSESKQYLKQHSKRHAQRRHFVLQLLAGALALSWKPAFAAKKAVAKKKKATGPVCRLVVEQEEGPYYIANEPLRSNLVEDREGVALTLRLLLLDMSQQCTPLKNASVEIWSCDAMGEYAGFEPGHMGPPPDGMPPPGMHGPRPDGSHPDGPPPGPPPHHDPDNEKTFLRGRQNTDGDGRVEFQTLYPGCYEGRVNHIHVRVRLNDGKEGRGRIIHTGQVYFPEAVTEAVLALPPYAAHDIHRTRAAEDMVFTRQHGETSVLEIEAATPGNIKKGFVGSIALGIDSSKTPAKVGF